uniref:Uncharacterized protein F1 n=1 Tax=viral metagenome TaxID=1070528 RepID=A0A445PPI4_9ZZZZ
MTTSFGKRTPPMGRPYTSHQDEPTLWTRVGSSVCFLADGKYLTEKASQSCKRSITSLDAVSRRLSIFAPYCASLHRTAQVCTVLRKFARPGVILRGTCA